MKPKFAHPLWAHLPALAALIVLLVYLISRSPLPAEAPIHFGFNGEPDNYGSPWIAFGMAIGFSVFFIALSAFLDELWARQEKAKSFNWLSLFDEIVVGMMTGISLGYLFSLRDGAGTFTFPWGYLGLVGGGATLLAVVFELMRAYRPYPGKLVEREPETLETELARQLKDNTAFVYWDYQNPFYVTLLTTILPLVMLAAAVIAWFDEPWASFLLLIVGVLLVIPYGGQRTLVTRQNITVRWGIIGIKVLRLKTAEITAVELHDFSPLKDFGGYGIRFNREMSAYYLRGRQGVKVTMLNGKKYLIGSDHPERLLTVVQLITGQR